MTSQRRSDPAPPRVAPARAVLVDRPRCSRAGAFVFALAAAGRVARRAAPHRRRRPGAPPTSLAPRPTFRAQANFVRVDVFPTQGRAGPIRDLVAQRTSRSWRTARGRRRSRASSTSKSPTRGRPRSAASPTRWPRRMWPAEDPRSRVFVIFLDTSRAEIAGSPPDASHPHQPARQDRRARRPVRRHDARVSAKDLTFARRTGDDGGVLRRSPRCHGDAADQIASLDPEEKEYESCFGMRTAVTQEMINRRREKRVLDAVDGT